MQDRTFNVKSKLMPAECQFELQAAIMILVGVCLLP